MIFDLKLHQINLVIKTSIRQAIKESFDSAIDNGDVNLVRNNLRGNYSLKKQQLVFKIPVLYKSVFFAEEDLSQYIDKCFKNNFFKDLQQYLKERSLKNSNFQIPSWIPTVNSDGTVSYVAEKGDTSETFANQFGLSKEQAIKLIGTDEIQPGITTISGQSVFNLFGSEVLKLDLNSKSSTKQRQFDQYLFGRDHSNSKGMWSFLATDYFTNNQFKNVLSGDAMMHIDGADIKVHYEIPVYRPAVFDGSKRTFALSNEPLFSKQTSGQTFPNEQENIHLELSHPNTLGRVGEYRLFIQRKYRDKVWSRLEKEFPNYNYIRITPSSDKN